MSASPHVDQPAPIVEGFDPLAHAFVADPAPFFARARREHPVFLAPGFDCWVVTRYDDIERVLLDWQTFSNNSLASAPTPEAFRDRVPDGWFAHAFNAMDPPEHTPVRKLGQQGFLRGRMQQFTGELQGIADDLVDAFEADGSCDLVTQFCYHMSQRSIVRLLGLPEDDLPALRHLAEDLPLVITDHIMPAAEREERWERVASVRAWCQELIDARRAQPREDMVSMLLSAGDDAHAGLSDDRIVTHMTELIFAGTDTTANLIANMVLLLDRHPEQLARLREDPSLWPAAVEEGLRRSTPGIGIFRLATREADVGGVTIPAGARVWLALASAGHDDEHFPDPLAFDVRRENAARHISFGKGRHLCMGAPLVRAEAPIALRTLYDRLPGLHVVPGQQLEYDPVILAPLLRSLRVAWPTG